MFTPVCVFDASLRPTHSRVRGRIQRVVSPAAISFSSSNIRRYADRQIASEYRRNIAEVSHLHKGVSSWVNRTGGLKERIACSRGVLTVLCSRNTHQSDRTRALARDETRTRLLARHRMASSSTSWYQPPPTLARICFALHIWCPRVHLAGRRRPQDSPMVSAWSVQPQGCRRPRSCLLD